MGAPLPRYRFNPEGLQLTARFGFPREFARQALDLIGIREGDRVLEVGCGTGAFTRLLLPAVGEKGALFGADSDPALLEIARRDVAGGDAAVAYERADAFALPHATGAFDAVVSQFLLCVLPDPLPALVEMARVTRPGGMIASISCFCKSGALPPFQGIGSWPGKDRYEELEPRFRTLFRTTIRNPRLGLPNGRDLAVWGDYKRAGLVDLRVTGFLTCYAPGDSRWTEAEAREYVERRERVDLGLLDRLDEAGLRTLEDAGLARGEVRELRELVAAKYRHLRDDPAGARDSMEIVADPTVLITGRVPG